MTCCDSIVHICLLLLSIILLSLSISTLVLTGQSITSPNTSAQYIFSATIIFASSLMFAISLINIVCSCKRVSRSDFTTRQTAPPVSCSVILVLLISVIIIALTSVLLSPDYSSSTKIPIWYSGSLLGISLLTLVVSIAIIASSTSCCVRDIDDGSPTVLPSGVQSNAQSGRLFYIAAAESNNPSI